MPLISPFDSLNLLTLCRNISEGNTSRLRIKVDRPSVLLHFSKGSTLFTTSRAPSDMSGVCARLSGSRIYDPSDLCSVASTGLGEVEAYD